MAISSPGLGSGLDINSIVSQLVAVERQPVKIIQAKVSTLQNKMSVFGQIKSELSSLQDASSALMSSSTWDSKIFSSSDTSAVTGSATSSALSSKFTLEVTSLAVGQSVKTSALASSYTASATGTLNIQLGTWASGSFTAGSVASVAVDVTAGQSLSTIAASINAKTASAGVTATVVTSGGTQQLLIRGTGTGAASGFQVSASAGLEALGYSAPTGAGMTQTQAAADAVLSVDGIDITSASNTVSDIVPGVTLNLLAPTTSPVEVGVAVDKTAIKAKIQTFVDSYNKLNTDLKTVTAYNAATKTGGPLLGDTTTTGLQSMLRNLVGSTGPAGTTLGRLSDLGLEIQSDGALKTNSTKLDAALQDPANVKVFFSASTGSAAGNGIAKRIYDFAFGATSVGGSVSTHSTGFQKAIDQNNASIEKFNTRIAAYQKQLLAQYTRLDTNMSSLNSLSTFVSAQITQWNKSG